MKIAFLFDPPDRGADSLREIAQVWWRGLVDSQHHVRIVARQGVGRELDGLPAQVELNEAMGDWSWWEAPKLFALLAPFGPQLVHLIVGRTPRWTQLWPALSVFQAWHVPVIVSVGDHAHWPDRWRFCSARLDPSHTRDLAIPGFLTAPLITAPRVANSVFIPGPIDLLDGLDQQLNRLAHTIEQNPGFHFRLGWDWSELRAPARQRWRSRFADLAGRAEITTLGRLSVSEQATAMAQSDYAFLAVLPESSWQAHILTAAAKTMSGLHVLSPAEWGRVLPKAPPAQNTGTSPKLLDQAINELARLYRDVSSQTIAGRGSPVA